MCALYYTFLYIPHQPPDHLTFLPLIFRSNFRSGSSSFSPPWRTKNRRSRSWNQYCTPIHYFAALRLDRYFFRLSPSHPRSILSSHQWLSLDYTGAKKSHSSSHCVVLCHTGTLGGKEVSWPQTTYVRTRILILMQ